MKNIKGYFMNPAHIGQQNLEPKKKKMPRIILSVVIILIVYGLFHWFYKPKDALLEKKEEAIVTNTNEQNPPEKSAEKVVNYTVADGDIPADVFSAQGKFDTNDTAALLLAAKDVYDLANIKIGQNIRFYFDQEERAKRLEYDRNTESLIIAERDGDDFKVREEKIAYEVSQKVVSATIKNFLYMDALAVGLSEATVLELGDVFAFNIDFTTEIMEGDQFMVVYEKRTREGKDAPDGRILGAKFINQGESHYAYYFDNDGSGGYYDAEGHLLERQFLKAPLSYRRISSGYTGSRRNPIIRKITAHYQIDYAAPKGTPIVSTARGTVTSAGWEGGWGNMVRIRHDNGYTTHYGHLSGFAKGIRSGSSVSQGQLVGFVGSTGWSTGPHLDYGMRINGAPVNPLNLKLPKGAPLGENKMGAFENVKNQYAEWLK